LRPTLQRIAPFAFLNLRELGGHRVAFALALAVLPFRQPGFYGPTAYLQFLGFGTKPPED
jgi:hypothetical protein